jgi:hypothetical protein
VAGYARRVVELRDGRVVRDIEQEQVRAEEAMLHLDPESVIV